jgi:ketosteroid isomerase-like protein
MGTSDQTAIHAIIDARCAAVRSGAIETSMADVDDDVVVFDVVGPLRHRGKAAALTRARKWRESYVGPPRLEIRDVEIFVTGDVAFSCFLSHASGKQKTGHNVDMWFRTTLGFQRKRGRWWIVHEHASVPLDPTNGHASLGLHP